MTLTRGEVEAWRKELILVYGDNDYINALCDLALSALSSRSALEEAAGLRSRIWQAINLIAANRQEIIQNGTCAYMSPRPFGLWVHWHYVEEIKHLVDPDAAAAKGKP